MQVTVEGGEVFIHTGGVEFDRSRPVVVLLHGAGQDHSHFRFHTRWLAHSGMSPLAVDLPGHGRSRGAVLDSMPALARWVNSLLVELAVERAVVVGHSMGSLIAIETAAAHPDRVAGIVLTGSGAAMPVHPDLLSAALAGDRMAVDLISGWVHTGVDRFGHHPQAGTWTRGITERLAERELGRSLGLDLVACASFDAATRAALVRVPATVVIGTADLMTSARSGRALAAALPDSTAVEIRGSGHNMVMDHPTEVRAAIVAMVASVFAG